MRIDGVDTQNRERRGQHQRNGPPRRSESRGTAHHPQHNAPRQHGSEPARDRRVRNGHQIVSTGQAHQPRLQDKRERRMHQGKIPIGHLPERYAPARIEQIAKIPQHGNPRVLPAHKSRGAQKQQGGRDKISQPP